MKNQKNLNPIDRRKAMKYMAAGSLFGFLGMQNSRAQSDNNNSQISYSKRGMPVVKIKNIKVILTAPSRPNLAVVKVETTEPGLYGLGCATFTQRIKVLEPAVNIYLNELCTGRDVDNIEDIWHAAYVSSYWRNGPVLNNALSGLDQALWDIKGKRAGMPVYQLLGGKSRFAVPCYTHARGNSLDEVAEDVQRKMDEGFKYVRIQMGGYGGTGSVKNVPDFREAGFGYDDDAYMNQRAYLDSVPKMFEKVRSICGNEVELLHDIHERVPPIDAINLIKNLEAYRPWFIEDPFSPEDPEWFKLLRATTSVPIAMGELFNNINEFKMPIVNQWFDFIRIHISQIGGITPAIKVAHLAEWFNIRTAWHGPGDVSPVGHAANCHIDLAIRNFGIQEMGFHYSDELLSVFSGCPVIKDGYMSVNEVPGLGVDINEKEAAKFPVRTKSRWQVRKDDGTIIKP